MSTIIDRSIWYEQVDAALLRLLKNHYDNVFCSKEISVVIRTPEKEFKRNDCPIVSIYGLADSRSYERDCCELQLLENINGVDCIVPKVKPVDLTYSIDFWSQYQSDMNKMTLEWESMLSPEKTFKVIRADGEEVPCYYRVKESQKSDLLSEGKRLFHTTKIINVHGLIDRFIPEPALKPKDIIFNTNNNKEVNKQ